MIDDALEVAQKLQTGFVVMFGAILGYLIEVMHFGATWSWRAFGTGAISGMIVGLLASDVVPRGMLDKKIGIMLLIGTVAFPIYRRAQEWIKTKADKQLGDS